MRKIGLIMGTVMALVAFLAHKAHGQGDIEVDHHTGRPIINIPVASVNDRTLSHRVSLFYDASGLRVDSRSGVVGQNWSLVAGGEVRRELRGLPDDYLKTNDPRKGWLNHTLADDVLAHSFPGDGGTLSSCSLEPDVYDFIDGFNDDFDSEPDLFHFNAGSLSGSFVFGNDGQIRLVPYQDLIVKSYTSDSSSIAKFEITTADGVKYVFDEVESTARHRQGPSPFYFSRDYLLYDRKTWFASAWKLSAVVSPSGERIEFHYTDKVVDATNTVSASIKNPSQNTYTSKYLYSVYETTTRLLLDEITSPHQRVAFTYDESLYTADRMLLKKIAIAEIDNVAGVDRSIRSVELAYKNIGSSLSGEGYDYRPYLHELRANDPDEVHRPYVFRYDDVNFTPGSTSSISLPNPGSKHQDIWGYYRTNASSDKVPKLYVYPSLTGLNRISLYPVSGQSDEIVIDGADRLPSSTPTIGVLDQIIYPSGGITTLEYEAHDFVNPITNAVESGGGLRVKKITDHDGIDVNNDIVRSFEYKTSGLATSGKLLILPAFWHLEAAYQDPATGTITDINGLSSLALEEQWKRLLVRTEQNLNSDADAVSSPVVYERVTERVATGQGKTVYSFSVPFALGSSPAGDWQPAFIHMARPDCFVLPAFHKIGYHYSPFSPQAPFDDALGLLTSVAVYAEGESNALKETIYTYSPKSVSAATVKGLRFELMRYSGSDYYFLYSDYVIPTNTLNVITQRRDKVRDRENPSQYLETVTDFTYGTSHALLAKVEVANSDGSTTISQFKYTKDYGPPGSATSDLQVNMIDAMNTAGQTGVLVERITSVEDAEGTHAYDGLLSMFDEFGNDEIIKPKEIRVLRTDGIQNFQMSAFNGSGSSRSFVSSTAYNGNVVQKLEYSATGDVIRSEDGQRQIQSFHPDNQTGLPVVLIRNAEPEEVVFSTFDHETDYSFDLSGFSAQEKTAAGRTGRYGLAGWNTGGNEYISGQFKKRPNSKYIFSAWYKPAATTGTHTFTVVVKNLLGTVLAQQTIPCTVTNEDWHFLKGSIDVSSIQTVDLVVEVKFSGNVSSPVTGILDDVSFKPELIEVSSMTYNSSHGISSATSPDGTITKKEYMDGGKLKYVRDHDNNIVQKQSYTRYNPDAQSSISPISFDMPSDVMDNTPITFSARTGGMPVATYQWKVTTSANPEGGSFVTGSADYVYNFGATGSYIVTLKTIHGTYGSYEASRTVEVIPAPLAVQICVVQGATTIDVCASHAYQDENCSGPINPPQQVSKTSTTFQAVPSVCAGGSTYTYQWYRRPLGEMDSPWTPLGTQNTQTVSNSSAYDILCVVTSDCGRTGQAWRIVQFYSSCGG